MSKITKQHVEALIKHEQYTHVNGSTLIICVLHLDNGYTVTGESACADPAIFNESYGRDLARKEAISKVFNLEGYLLRQRMFEESLEAAIEKPEESIAEETGLKVITVNSVDELLDLMNTMARN